jgi:hypothetical protein
MEHSRSEPSNDGNPVTIRAASSCTFSNLSEFVCPQLSHTSDAYSNTGLINVK